MEAVAVATATAASVTVTAATAAAAQMAATRVVAGTAARMAKTEAPQERPITSASALAEVVRVAEAQVTAVQAEIEKLVRTVADAAVAEMAKAVCIYGC